VAQQAQAPANRRRISGGQALVLLAVWTAILPFTWVSVAPRVDPAWVDPAVVVVHGCVVAVTATPLVFARLGRAALRRASLVASLLLFVAILPVGLFLGLGLYLPAAGCCWPLDWPIHSPGRGGQRRWSPRAWWWAWGQRRCWPVSSPASGYGRTPTAVAAT
jgi:hypothetical protein